MRCARLAGVVGQAVAIVRVMRRGVGGSSSTEDPPTGSPRGRRLARRRPTVTVRPTHPVRAAPAGRRGGRRVRAAHRLARLGLAVLVGLALALSVVLRFWTTSDLWLDEALTVNIAGQPIHTLPALLRRDGAPPLYYLLLHLWMGVVGSSDHAVRALSGAISVVTIPVAWLAGRRLGGRAVAWGACLLVASSPFAIRYSTETRMYSLVVLLTALGFLALTRVLEHPRVGCLVALAAVTGLLLYTHYWALYLVAVTGVWLAFHAVRRRGGAYPGAGAALAAVAVGCATFVPWLSVFLYQARHTGTPWAGGPTARAMVNAFSSMGGGTVSGGHVLAAILLLLGAVGLVDVRIGRRPAGIDLSTRPLGRPLAFVVVATLVLAVVAGHVAGSAYDGRYVSIVFLPYILLAALGLSAVPGRWGPGRGARPRRRDRSRRRSDRGHDESDPGGGGRRRTGAPRPVPETSSPTVPTSSGRPSTASCPPAATRRSPSPAGPDRRSSTGRTTPTP